MNRLFLSNRLCCPYFQIHRSNSNPAHISIRGTTLEERLDVDRQMKNFIKRNEAENALLLFQKVARFTKTPKLDSHFIEFIAKKRGYNAAVDIFASYPISDAGKDSILYLLMKKHRNFHLARSFLLAFEEQGFSASNRIHWYFFRHYCEKRDVSAAAEYFSTHESIQNSTKFIIPFIRLLLLEGEAEQAKLLMQTITNDKLPLLQHFQTEIFALSGKIDRMLASLMENGAATYTYIYILNYLFDNNREAYRKTLDAIASNRIGIDLGAMNSFARSLVRKEEFDELQTFLAWAEQLVEFDYKMVRELAITYIRQEDFDKLNQLYAKYYEKQKSQWKRDNLLANIYTLRRVMNLLE